MKNVIKKVICSGLALGLIATMMPGLSMVSKAATGVRGTWTDPGNATVSSVDTAQSPAPDTTGVDTAQLVTVYLVPDEGYEFATAPTLSFTNLKANGDATGTSPATAASATATVSSDGIATVTLTWASDIDDGGSFTFRSSDDATPIDYSVRASVSPSGAGTVTVPTDKQTEAHIGDTVTLTKTENKGYVFQSWKITYTDENGDEQTIKPNGDSFVMPAADVTVVANFVDDPRDNGNTGGGTTGSTPAQSEDSGSSDSEDGESTDGEDGSTTDGEGGETTDGEGTGSEDGEGTDGSTTDGGNGEGTGDGDSAAENPFTDVVKSGDNDPYYDAIIWAAKNNVVKGKSETSYDPNGTATRVEFTTMMHRLLKDIVPGNPGTTSRFADCQNLIEDFTNAVLWAESLEPAIIQGVDANNFAPNAPITRAQVVTLIWRAAGSPEPKSAITAFTDLTEDYYKKAVAWGVEQGIVMGTSATTFAPNQPVTRAQLATFLYRAVVEAKVFGG